VAVAVAEEVVVAAATAAVARQADTDDMAEHADEDADAAAAVAAAAFSAWRHREEDLCRTQSTINRPTRRDWTAAASTSAGKDGRRDPGCPRACASV